MADAPKIISEFKPGRTYLFEDREEAFNVAKTYANPRIFTTETPEILKEDFGIAGENYKIFTLRKQTELSAIVRDARADLGEHTAIVIDGLDYLVATHHDLAANTFYILREFVQDNKDKDCILIVPVDKATLEPKEYALFCSRNIIVPKKA